MKIVKLLTLLPVVMLVASCAGFGQVESVSSLSSDQLRQIHSIQMIDTELNRSYETLGRVKGISCKGSGISGSTNEAAALTQLKIKAVKLGANAILYPTCAHDASVDWGNNCWESWVCVGDALLIE